MMSRWRDCLVEITNFFGWTITVIYSFISARTWAKKCEVEYAEHSWIGDNNLSLKENVVWRISRTDKRQNHCSSPLQLAVVIINFMTVTLIRLQRKFQLWCASVNCFIRRVCMIDSCVWKSSIINHLWSDDYTGCFPRKHLNVYLLRLHLYLFLLHRTSCIYCVNNFLVYYLRWSRNNLTYWKCIAFKIGTFWWIFILLVIALSNNTEKNIVFSLRFFYDIHFQLENSRSKL